jgi:stress response protein SCP2
MNKLIRGQKIKLSDLFNKNQLHVGLAISSSSDIDLDISCFGVDDENKLSDDRYFIFFNQKTSPCGSISILGAQNGDQEQFYIDLSRLPKAIYKLVFVITVDGNGMLSQINHGCLKLIDQNTELARFTFSGSDFKDEKSIMVGEIYLKDVWRFSAVGQGFNGGLSTLLKYFGGQEIFEIDPPKLEPAKASEIQISKSVLLEKNLEKQAPQLIDIAKKPSVALEKEMSNIDNLKILASTALESGSHEDLYKYGSAILELNAGDGDAWIYKAAGAALNTDDIEKRIKEAKVLITKAISLGTNKSTASLAAQSLFSAYKIQMSDLDDVLLGKVKDYQKVAMPKGGSALVHGFAQTLNKVLSAKAQAPARAACAELLVLACDLNPTKENFVQALELVDTLEAHAKKNSDYFAKSEFENLTLIVRKEISNKACDLIPNFVPLATLPNKKPKPEGCFIATAATGSYNHPKVLFLREFRDEVLAKYNFGRLVIHIYYDISPNTAKIIARHPILKILTVKLFIDPVIFVIKTFKI